MTGLGPNQTRRRALGFLGLLGVCLALVEVKAATAPAPHRITLPQSTTTPTTSGSGSPDGKGSSVREPTAAAGTRSVTGQAIDVSYGIVQVRVTLSGSRLTDVEPLRLPSGGRSGSIASYAAPLLRSEVLAAQSASIDTVSGASYTSEGYARSVQSALDAARG